jgi:hypothetical protein
LASEYNSSPKTIGRYCLDTGQDRKGSIPCPRNEEKVQSYRDNLAWAMNAAGEQVRTGAHPETCPNNSAWFLYIQAINEPKDFMAKVASIESKIDPGEDEREIKAASKKTLLEIENFLKGMPSGEEKIEE